MSLPLDNQARIDWASIILFYAALHYVEAYLAKMGQHLRSHTTRDLIVGKDSNLKKIYKAEDVTQHAAKDFATIKASIRAIL